MALPPDKAWWPRKTAGYGWTWPTRWQGWAVTIAYCLCLLAAALTCIPAHPGYFFGILLGASVILVALSYWKGEAPDRP